MSEPIKVGDLVQVVRPKFCGCMTLCGHVFKVENFTHWDTAPGTLWKCPTCAAGGICDGIARQVFATGLSEPGYENSWQGVNVNRLKRIPPLSELEGQRAEEPLKLPRKEIA